MSDEHLGSRLAALLRTLKPKTKEPVSTKVLNTWIAQAEGQLGDEARGGRLGWLIASSVAIAAVQRAIDTEGRHLFLLKGGTLLQHRLNATARTTKDRRPSSHRRSVVSACRTRTPWSGSRCASRSRRSFTRSPTRTSRRTRSTTAPAMSSIYSCPRPGHVDRKPGTGRGPAGRDGRVRGSGRRGGATRPGDSRVASRRRGSPTLGRRLRPSRDLGGRKAVTRRGRRPGQCLDQGDRTRWTPRRGGEGRGGRRGDQRSERAAPAQRQSHPRQVAAPRPRLTVVRATQRDRTPAAGGDDVDGSRAGPR